MKYETKIKIVISVIILTLFICAGGFYIDDYYRAEDITIEVMQSNEHVKVVTDKDQIAFIPQEAKTGFIFYPGGKVEFSAYNCLLHSLAENGILCVVVKMPCNLAVLNIDAAKNIPTQYKEIDTWYIGGHSLGGSMAASYIADTTDTYYEGLVLLASYSTEDFSSKDIKILSLYGSEDKVLNMDKYKEYVTNFSHDTQEIILDGGNHAQFGNYGKQKKDGNAKISNEEQISQTVNYIYEFMQ